MDKKRKIITIVAITIFLIVGTILIFAIIRQNISTDNSETTSGDDEKKENYLVISEWNIKFTLPDTITDVWYRIEGNTAYFVSKPKGFNVEFVADLDSNFAEYSRIILERSTEPFIVIGEPYYWKKIDNHYFITTAESRITGLFGDVENADSYENIVFDGINQMLNTIQSSK
jgi:hypothetical protein